MRRFTIAVFLLWFLLPAATSAKTIESTAFWQRMKDPEVWSCNYFSGIRILSGDTLGKIAAFWLGQSGRWPEIHSWNPQIANPPKLRAGDCLNMPPYVITEGLQRLSADERGEVVQDEGDYNHYVTNADQDPPPTFP